MRFPRGPVTNVLVAMTFSCGRPLLVRVSALGAPGLVSPNGPVGVSNCAFRFC